MWISSKDASSTAKPVLGSEDDEDEGDTSGVTIGSEDSADEDEDEDEDDDENLQTPLAAARAAFEADARQTSLGGHFQWMRDEIKRLRKERDDRRTLKVKKADFKEARRQGLQPRNLQAEFEEEEAEQRAAERMGFQAVAANAYHAAADNGEAEQAEAQERPGQERVKVWSFTFKITDPYNIPEPKLGPGVKYLRWQTERGTQGSLHLQGVAVFNTEVRFGSARTSVFGHSSKAYFKAVHLRQQSLQAIIDYVWKDETAVEGTRRELGTNPVFERVNGRGSMSGASSNASAARKISPAYEEVIRMATDVNVPLTAIQEQYPNYWISKVTQIEKVRKHAMMAQPGGRFEDLKVYALWGDYGAGKTRNVKYMCDTMYPNDQVCYIRPTKDGKLWFDNWDGHAIVVVEDIKKGIARNDLLMLTDEYVRNQVWEVKGGKTKLFNLKAVFFTSNYSPDTWIDDDAQSKGALLRRITSTAHFQIPAGQAEDNAARKHEEMVIYPGFEGTVRHNGGLKRRYNGDGTTEAVGRKLPNIIQGRDESWSTLQPPTLARSNAKHYPSPGPTRKTTDFGMY